MKKIIYYLLNLGFHNFEEYIILLLKKEKFPIIFDVGCFRGYFSKKIFDGLNRKKIKFYLYDPNINVKNYLLATFKKKYLKKFFNYKNIALGKKKGKNYYYLNRSFEASGSSLSTLVKDDKLYNFSRKLFLKLLFQKTPNYMKFSVDTSTINAEFKRKKLKKIDVLKIDVDGTEVDVLKGANNLFRKNLVKIVLVEIASTKNKYKAKESLIINFLKQYNLILKKKYTMISPSILSNIRASDYLFLNNKFY